MNSLSRLVDSFLHFQKLDRGASQHTISSYRNDLNKFSTSLSPSLKDDIRKISATNIQHFLDEMVQSGQKSSSLSRAASSLRQFFKFCCLEGHLEISPADSLKTPARPNRLPKTLSHAEVEALLEQVKTGKNYKHSVKEALQQRDRAMVFLLYATGMRVSELVELKVRQVDTEEGLIRVKGKGGKERVIPFAPIAGEYLIEYIQNGRLQLGDPSEALFCNHRGKAITRQAFWLLLKELAHLAEVPHTLSPHVLRHSFATHLLQSGINLRTLQGLLGHSDLSTTQIYTHINAEHLKETHRKYHPRGD